MVKFDKNGLVAIAKYEAKCLAKGEVDGNGNGNSNSPSPERSSRPSGCNISMTSLLMTI